jgi:cell division protein FtsA
LLTEIVEPRMHELFTLVKQEILKSGHYNLLPAGIVLSGGGALLAGAEDLCRQVTGMPTRIGAPASVSGLPESVKAPFYSTAVGLTLYGSRAHRRAQQAAKDNSLLGRLHRWLNRHAAKVIGQ